MSCHQGLPWQYLAGRSFYNTRFASFCRVTILFIHGFIDRSDHALSLYFLTPAEAKTLHHLALPYFQHSLSDEWSLRQVIPNSLLFR
jgi:hypothetical protein